MNGNFFYLILTAHYIKLVSGEFVQLLGYGITTVPKKRSKQYSDHSGIEQEFAYLFYGSTMQIKSLESIIKQRVASEAHMIYGQPVEWLKPKSSHTIDTLLKLVKDTIKQEGFNIRILKDEFLPFNNLDHHRKISIKEINANPDEYLAELLLDKKRKK